MVVKLGMDVDQCIETYKRLSKEIFGYRHMSARLTLGFGSVKKFCGKRLEHVLKEQVIKPRFSKNSKEPENFCMEEVYDHPDQDW